MKILVYDVETFPNLAYVWGIWDQNIGVNQIAESHEVACFAAKWVGQHKIIYRSLYSDGKEQMIQDMWDLFDEADAVIGYNCKKFDTPHMNREFLEQEMTPPSPYRQIDLLPAVRKAFKFPSYKLEYVSAHLGCGEKMKHAGFPLWKGCMANEESSWKTMRLYNVNDVAITELVYERIKPWIPNHPSFASFEQDFVCPACGSEDLQKEGFAYTQQGRYQRYVCRSCGKWSRSTEAHKDEVTGERDIVRLREVAS